MDPERWQRVKQLFERSVRRSEAERLAFLDEACPGDPELRREVESLLAVYRDHDSLLEQPPAVDLISEEEIPDAGAQAGRTLGPWRLLHQIGRGGMGAVYLAERSQAEFQQRAAVKLVKRGLDTDAVLERFRQERRILAGLEHPNIARLLDGGATADGLPYFVMEHVEGTPLDRYCDDRRLSVTRRLELFCAVCSAVQYAHQKLVVHRDLKPGNILVTADGVPKLLDFGIARLLGPDLSAPATRLTTAQARPLTPEYASPEQLRGEPITAASDVYSLGVLLYELLTGGLPYRLESRSPEAAARLVADTEPLRPSAAIARGGEAAAPEGATPAPTPAELSARRRASPERLRRRLAGDLDNIVLRALAKEPAERYASVAHLTEDLECHLAGLPVSARGRTAGYLMAKFVRRHRIGVAAAAVVTLLILALVALSIRYTVDLRRERNAAEQKEQEAKEVTGFLVDLFRVPDPASARGRTITAQEILATGAEKIERELVDQPLTQARLMTVIGEVRSRLGLQDEAEELLRRALEIRRATLGEDDLEIAESLESLAGLLATVRDYSQAEALYRQALAIRLRQQEASDPAIASRRVQLANSLRFQGKLEEADLLSRQALETVTAALDPDDPEVLNALHSRAVVLTGRGEYQAALEVYADLLERKRRVLGPDHPDIPPTLNNMGYVLLQLEDFDGAERRYRESLAVLRQIVGEAHPHTVRVMMNLASVHANRGEYAQAEALMRRVVDLRRSLLPPDHWRVGDGLMGVGRILLDQRRWAEAEASLREALAIYRAGLAPRNTRSSKALGFLAACQFGLGRRQEAAESVSSSLEIYDSFEVLKPYDLSSMNQIAEQLDAVGRPAEAARFRELASARAP